MTHFHRLRWFTRQRSRWAPPAAALAALLGCACATASSRAQAPTAMGFTLSQPLSRYRSALSHCNPAAELPAAGLRFCSAERDSVTVTLGFLRDSLVQVSFSTVTRGISGNASDLWSRQRDSLATAFGRPADSVVVKPAHGSIVEAGPDPRGSSAQALTALWRLRPTDQWCAKVFVTDEATPSGEPLTRMAVDVFAMSGPDRPCPVIPVRKDPG